MCEGKQTGRQVSRKVDYYLYKKGGQLSRMEGRKEGKHAISSTTERPTGRYRSMKAVTGRAKPYKHYI